MRFLHLLLPLLFLVSATLAADGEKVKVKKLQIGVKKRVENCKIKSRRGDLLKMHYTVRELKLLFDL
jgi:FK506-binding protein 2